MTMGNLRKRISVKLVNNEKDYLKHVSKPTYVSRRNLNIMINIMLLFMKVNQFYNLQTNLCWIYCS